MDNINYYNFSYCQNFHRRSIKFAALSRKYVSIIICISMYHVFLSFYEINVLLY